MGERKKHIILTDDDPGVQDAAKLLFERAGYAVTVYSNGVPLLKNDFETPDLFILDKQLSGVDGLDICRFLKNQQITAHIPVIMLSASPQLGKLSMAAGADAFVEKPFRMKDILATIRQYI
jgi:two-component system response regulator RpaA